MTRWRHIRLRRLLVTAVAVGVVLPIAAVVLFRFVPPPVTPHMLVNAIVLGEGLDYRWRPLRAISPQLVRAAIAAEDTRFMQHHGFDWTEVDAALRAGRRGARLRGASTISMQCARSLFLWPGRSLIRKALEAYLTALLESLWSKARIIEVYLNIVEWGDGVYGCEAAARRNFQLSCTAVDLEQAALLAAVLPNPHRWSPARPSRYIWKRAGVIRSRMLLVAVPASVSGLTAKP